MFFDRPCVDRGMNALDPLLYAPVPVTGLFYFLDLSLVKLAECLGASFEQRRSIRRTDSKPETVSITEQIPNASIIPRHLSLFQPFRG